MAQLAPIEAGLRKTVMLHSKGDLQEAINVARQNVAKVKNSKDLRLKIRKFNSLEHVAASMLRECQTAAQIHSLENIDAMINRRLAYIDQLKALSAARREFHHAGVPLLEKAAIAEAAKLYNSYNRITERDECATSSNIATIQLPDWTGEGTDDSFKTGHDRKRSMQSLGGSRGAVETLW
ncbi:unnamed protein product [Gongylonema pulchrum]|uniref:Vps5 domain-containing protein n=1 Tax=Gongylonema pulchrum TaxID=637853 RepID=A0A183E7H2_9BILA|nr:unnamed protein product [Gongylonema pulchrum]